jgi:hypothetical protein
MPRSHITIRINYAIKLDPAFPGDRRLLDFSRTSLPAVQHGTPNDHHPQDSEGVVDFEIEPDGVEALGPVYIDEMTQQPTHGSRFLMQPGNPFHIYLGRLATLCSSGSVPLTALEPARAVAQLRGDADYLAEMASAVRQHFHELFGAAFVKHCNVVVFDTPGAPSKCLGSSIFINLTGPCAPPLSRDARVRALHTLAHEYAHSWMYYGVRWRPGLTSWLLNEALASPLALDAVERISGNGRVDAIIEKDLWAMIGDSLTRPIPSFGFGSRRAVSAGLVLEAMRREHRGRLISVLKNLRDEGRRTSLSMEAVAEALDQRIQSGGAAARQAFRHPRPLVTQVRKIRPSLEGSFSLDGPWTLVLKGSRGAIRTLSMRLDGSDLGRSATRSARQVSWSGSGAEALRRLINRLEPWYVVSRGRERELWLHRHPTIKKLWVWADRTCLSHAERNQPGLGARLRLLVATSLALTLNPERPSGYLAATRLLAGFSMRLARWLGHMALARTE